MKLTLSFWSSRFDTWPKSQDKNLNILRTKKLLRTASLIRKCFPLLVGISLKRSDWADFNSFNQSVWVTVEGRQLGFCSDLKSHYLKFWGTITIDFLSWLTHFMPLVSFYNPWKHPKTSGFLMISGVIERDHWHKMG